MLTLMSIPARNWGCRTTPYTRNNEWQTEFDRLMSTWFPLRTGVLLNQLKSDNLFPSIDAPTFAIDGQPQHGGGIDRGDALTMGNPNGSGTIYYTLDGTDPRLAGGSVSPAAIAYGGSITLNASPHVMARVRNGTLISGCAMGA